MRRLAVLDGIVVADAGATLPGRGAYLCSDDCASSGATAPMLSRAFRQSVTVPSDFVESLIRG